MHTDTTVALKRNFMSSLFLCAVFLKIFIVKIQRYLLFIFLVLNAVFITVYHFKAVQDDISAKSVPIWLHHTVIIQIQGHSNSYGIQMLKWVYLESRVNIQWKYFKGYILWCSQIFSMLFCWSRIFDWIIKNTTILLIIFFNETPKGSMIRTFHPVH